MSQPTEKEKLNYAHLAPLVAHNRDSLAKLAKKPDAAVEAGKKEAIRRERMKSLK